MLLQLLHEWRPPVKEQYLPCPSKMMPENDLRPPCHILELKRNTYLSIILDNIYMTLSMQLLTRISWKLFRVNDRGSYKDENCFELMSGDLKYVVIRISSSIHSFYIYSNTFLHIETLLGPKRGASKPGFKLKNLYDFDTMLSCMQRLI